MLYIKVEAQLGVDLLKMYQEMGELARRLKVSVETRANNHAFVAHPEDTPEELEAAFLQDYPAPSTEIGLVAVRRPVSEVGGFKGSVADFVEVEVFGAAPGSGGIGAGGGDARVRLLQGTLSPESVQVIFTALSEYRTYAASLQQQVIKAAIEQLEKFSPKP